MLRREIIAVCSENHVQHTKHTVWAESTIFECKPWRFVRQTLGLMALVNYSKGKLFSSGCNATSFSQNSQNREQERQNTHLFSFPPSKFHGSCSEYTRVLKQIGKQFVNQLERTNICEWLRYGCVRNDYYVYFKL